jgi:hypothetical protein
LASVVLRCTKRLARHLLRKSNTQYKQTDAIAAELLVTDGPAAVFSRPVRLIVQKIVVAAARIARLATLAGNLS